MKLIDLHSHWGTRRGYPLQKPEELAQQQKTWRSAPRYVSEDEMAQDLRASGVRAMLDLGFTKDLPLDEVRELHDYALEFGRRHSDVVIGHWLQIDPRTGADGVAELDRCLRADAGLIGYCVSGSAVGLTATDPAFEPFYCRCIEAGAPVLILVGYVGRGAGLPGGGGLVLEHSHPRYVDQVAARFPDLTIVAGRPAWPWQTEMIAVLLHKTNVWYELHGWSPKYLAPDLQHDIARRLQDRVMFGADYPLFTYERLISDWRKLGFDEEILSKIFHGNAERFLESVCR